MICRKATFTVSVPAVTLSNAILRLPEHKKPDFVLEKPENKGFRPQNRTKMPILCSKVLKTRVLKGKSAQKSQFCARGWLPRAQHYLPRALRGASGSSAPGNRLPQPTTQPAAVHAAGNCPRATYRRGVTAGTPTPRTSYLPLILPCIPPWRYRRGATAKTTVVCYRRGTTAVQPARRGILPCSGSRAQRAGDSDVGANDKGAGDDPGDGVDAH